MVGTVLNALHILSLLVLTHVKKAWFYHHTTIPTVQAELKQKKVNQFSQGVSVAEPDSHSGRVVPKPALFTMEPESGFVSKPLLGNTRKPFTLEKLKVTLFAVHFSNLKFFISLMESNNMNLILV